MVPGGYGTGSFFGCHLQKNWIKVDVTREVPTDKLTRKLLKRTYSDYPDFRVALETIFSIDLLPILIFRRQARLIKPIKNR